MDRKRWRHDGVHLRHEADNEKPGKRHQSTGAGRIRNQDRVWQAALAYALGLALIGSSTGCGKALPLLSERTLQFEELGTFGATSQRGSDLGNIYEVTQIVEAPTGGIPGWTMADLPFNVGILGIGDPLTTDRQTTFLFSYTYPQNNYKLADALLVIDTARDNSDTEAIFVDGVFTGIPPATMINATAAKVTHALYQGNGGVENTYYIDWSVAHYKQNTRNTFTLNMTDLLEGSDLTATEVVSDGYVPVVTGDDSPVYQGYLVLKGYTISKVPLTCADSPSYTFQNVFLHNDGNSVNAAAFDSGTVKPPNTSWTGVRDAGQSVEFYYDSALPRADLDRITISTGSISMRVKRAATGAAAIVVNGVGLAEAAFDRDTATDVVEEWIEDATAINAFTSWVGTIPATETDTTVSLNILSYYGESRLKTLISQGKLNVAVAGSLGIIYGQAATSTRQRGTVVNGPELNLAGTYTMEICEVPNNPDSPLRDDAEVPDGIGDETSPVVSSVQVTEITSSSAVVQWLTDEPATSQVLYGIGNSDSSTTATTTYSTFHRVTITGLLPYKFYQFQVRTADHNGNATTSAIDTFRTLR